MSRQDQVVATTFVLRSCRDKIRLSRQHLHWEDVATRSSCRENNYTERTSRQDQVVATTTCDKACDNNLRQSLQQQPATKPATRPATTCDKTDNKTCDKLRQDLRQPATKPATRPAKSCDKASTTSAYWASLLKSNKKCLEIRAQLQNPINMKLQKRKRSWVAT